MENIIATWTDWQPASMLSTEPTGYLYWRERASGLAINESTPQSSRYLSRQAIDVLLEFLCLRNSNSLSSWTFSITLLCSSTMRFSRFLSSGHCEHPPPVGKLRER
jgi:hypothetical protein